MEYIDVVDENDIVLRNLPRQEIQEKNLPRRAVHVLLFNSKGKFVSQLRAKDKRIYPNHWSSSARGLVSAGEEPSVAASRELEEEMECSVSLALVGKFRQKNEVVNEFVYVYAGKSEGPFVVDEEET